MFKNYFKIAWRNLWKNRTFTGLNIIGLTVVRWFGGMPKGGYRHIPIVWD